MKCFDRINHDFLLRSVPVYQKVDRNVLRKMLKAKIIYMSLLATPNTQVKTVALYKLCHSRVHKDLQNSSKNQRF